MTSQEALEVLVNAKFCRNAEHEKRVNEAIGVLQDLIDWWKINQGKVKYGIILDKYSNGIWSIGMRFTHVFKEAYLYISLFKYSISIGKLARFKD